jgi:hypothetical protein
MLRRQGSGQRDQNRHNCGKQDLPAVGQALEKAHSGTVIRLQLQAQQVGRLLFALRVVVGILAGPWVE